MDNKSNGGLIILLVALGWSIFFHKDNYEGKNAEEWFNQYRHAEAGLNTTQNEFEEYISNMENESTMKDCIEKNDELTRTVLGRLKRPSSLAHFLGLLIGT